MILTSVDLPAPFSPSSACTSPGRRSKLTPSSARTPGKLLAMPFSSKIGSVMPALFGGLRHPPQGVRLDLRAAVDKVAVLGEAELGDHVVHGERLVDALQREQVLVVERLQP